ncbi:amidohydrolase family protein [Streptomyces griseoruber]|uniref:Amidohydrolase n=1 Tax=Streptomyces griseoruber TaxID=1943 RepID=A0A101SJF6_9ACTN|nr:amidohydrolase family protein [Streptomyces griseoruber]KUN74977.1 amidohydrolase [Streptomyces griseoruber]
MIENTLVVEGVAHDYNFLPENCVNPAFGRAIGEHMYQLHAKWGGPGYAVEKELYLEHGAGAEAIGRSILAESQSDVVVYHETPIYGHFRDGGSALSSGLRMRELWPNRVLVYGAVSPLRPGAVDRVDELVDEHRVNALKLYPIDLVEGRVTSLDMSDPEVCYPVFERARERGIKVIGIHKALPVGPGPAHALRIDDIEGAAAAFPDLTFEVVHGGLAFVEETAMLMECAHNVVVNLEVTSALARTAPRRFAEAMGAFLAVPGGAQRVIWGTGVIAVHPRPIIEAFWNFETPQDLIEERGVEPLTLEAKKDILGRNFLRLHGIDEDKLRATIAGDEFDTDELAPAWGGRLQADAPAVA